MSRWFRHYAGMMTDEKLVSAAVKSKQTVERVIWVWGAILESASEINDGGRYEFDSAAAAYFLRCDESELDAVTRVLGDLGRVCEGFVCQWKARQYESDTSTERVRKHRAKRTENDTSARDSVPNGERNDGETLQQRSVTPPEAEADTKAEAEAEPKEESRAAACVEIGQRITDYMGVTNDPRWLGNWSTVSVWLSQGFDPELDILPTVMSMVERFRRTGKPMPGSLKYFSRAIADNHKQRLTTGQSTAQAEVKQEFATIRKGSPSHRAWMAHFRGQGRKMAFYEQQELLTVPTEYPPTQENEVAA